MNIFVTDKDPIIAAENLCDQHVRSKMQIEGAIMLAHAFTQDVLDHPATPKTQSGKSRRRGKGYFNHQCSIWARESKDNFMWLVDHTLQMFDERMWRWPDSAEHFTKTFIQWCKDNIHNTIMSKRSLTPFAVAINQDCECRQDPKFDQYSVQDQYRLYYQYDKPFATWTTRQSPEWFLEKN